MTVAAEPTAEAPPTRKRRIVKIAAWLVGLALFWLTLQLLGVDVRGWLEQLWDDLTSIPTGYLIAAVAVQTGSTVFAGVSYYGILSAAYPGEVRLAPIVAGGIVTLVVVGRIFWRQVKKLWERAKQGGAILSQPGRYMSRVFLPSFLSWTCGRMVTAIFLAAFALPVTFQSVMWVTGSGSLANVTSFTPGAVGVTQATNALALKTCCQVAKRDAVDYSTAQQLVTTGWNQIVAIVLVVVIFGWAGGKQLVGQSYVQAKEKSAEMKAEHKRKRLARRRRKG